MISKLKLMMTFAFIFLASVIYAQVPQLFNYQGIARDAKGNPMGNQRIALKISVLPASDATSPEYQETQLVTTNEFGLYNLQIGNGQALSGEMKTVKWETGNKYIQVAIDPKGGNNFELAGTSQLLSVPYALYADKAGSSHEKTRTGAVSSNAAHVAGDVNYLTKFTAYNTIGKSQLFDNGTSVGIGTATPGGRLHIYSNSNSVIDHVRMHNAHTTGAGRFIMYNDVPAAYATFTKYGSTYPGGYAGMASLYPYANLLAFGNNGPTQGDGNGRFLISTSGNVGISVYKGSSKLKFHVDYSTLNVAIGGNTIPMSRVHFSNTDSTYMDLRLTNNTSGHTANDGLVISEVGAAASIINAENSTLSLGTNNATQMTFTGAGNVGVGTTTPTAKLDVNGQARIGSLTGVGSRPVYADPNGILVIGNNNNNNNAWSLNGNAGTVDSTNFIGTTDSVTLNIRVNNQKAGRIGYDDENTSWGYQSLNNNVGMYNTANGYKALLSNTVGWSNTANGYKALYFNTTGDFNTANGYATLGSNTTGFYNTANGYAALYSNTTGGHNTANGETALYYNTTGGSNTANGSDALYKNTTGSYNTANGSDALFSNTTGDSNVAVGNYALYNSQSTSNLVAVGDHALYANTTGIGNVAVGNMALTLNSIGSYNSAHGFRALYNNNGYSNTAHGYKSLYANTTGNYNTGIGSQALLANSTGSENTSIGTNSMVLNTTGNTNTAIGTNALYSNTTGYSNVGIGTKALYSNSTLSNLVAIGDSALYSNSTGWYNTAIGSKSLYSNTGGYYNTANGYSTLYSNITGDGNTANGYNTLYSNTTGSRNTANGSYALKSNTTGGDNVANGYTTLYSNTTGGNNTANGYSALSFNTTGNYNTANGSYALNYNTTGSNNTANGNQALINNTSGNYNIAIGSESGIPNGGPFNNTISIGNHGYLNGNSNKAFIGNLSTTWIGGNVNWSTYSDGRIKKNIQEDVKGLDFIMRLRPVTYNKSIQKVLDITGNKYDADFPEKYDIENVKISGFIAQEVEKAAKESGYDFSGVHVPKTSAELYSVSYAEFVVPLVKAVQELGANNEELKKQNENLQKQIDELRELIKK